MATVTTGRAIYVGQNKFLRMFEMVYLLMKNAANSQTEDKDCTSTRKVRPKDGYSLLKMGFAQRKAPLWKRALAREEAHLLDARSPNQISQSDRLEPFTQPAHF